MMIRAADPWPRSRHADRARRGGRPTPDWSPGRRRGSASRPPTTGTTSPTSTRLSEAGVGSSAATAGSTVRVVSRVGERRVRRGPARRHPQHRHRRRPALPIDGLDATPYWTNREVMKARRPAVVADRDRRRRRSGASWRRSSPASAREVTLLEVADRILGRRRSPSPSPSCIDGCSRDEGIAVRTGVKIERVDHVDGSFVVRVDGADAARPNSCSWPPAGAPTSATSGWRRVGLDPAVRSVATDERMRAAERLWAVGDITGHGAFTHVSMYQGAVAVRGHPR